MTLHEADLWLAGVAHRTMGAAPQKITAEAVLAFVDLVAQKAGMPVLYSAMYNIRALQKIVSDCRQRQVFRAASRLVPEGPPR